MTKRIEIELARARFFPNTYILREFQRLPKKLRPVYGVYCRNHQEVALAQALAPSYDNIKYFLPENLGVDIPKPFAPAP